MDTISQPIDYLGVNYYFSATVRYDPRGGLLKANTRMKTLPLWGFNEMGWGVDPSGLTAMLVKVKENYANPPVYITENGCAALDEPDSDGFVHDRERIAYVRRHLIAAHDALQAGVDLRGYFLWSLMDNFEWAHGYRPRLGIVRIDYATLERVPKLSAWWYHDVIASNRVTE